MNRLSARREPFSRAEKLLFGALPFGILGFVLSGLWIARVDELPLITFPTPAALPSPNGFDFYVAAAGAITPANPAVDPVDDRRAPLAPVVAAQNYSFSRRTAWLSTNRAGFSLLKKALSTPSRHPNLTLPGQGVAPIYPNYADLRQLARSKVIEANTLILQKRWGAATGASLDTIQMGYDIARGGPLMARLVGSAVTAIGRDPLFTDQMVPERLTAAEARAAAKRLEAILAARPNYHDSLIAGKWQSLAEFVALVKKGNWRALATQNNPDMEWRERIFLQFLSAPDVAKRISDGFDRSARDLQTPYSAAKALQTPAADPITAQFLPTDLKFNQGREFVPFDVLLLRFALRAYRLENGRFPEALSQLAPRYLKRIPSDYFAAGAPFHFRKKGQNYDLWSVGPDGVDNGGVPIVSYDGKAGANQAGRFPSMLRESSGDYVAGKNR